MNTYKAKLQYAFSYLAPKPSIVKAIIPLFVGILLVSLVLAVGLVGADADDLEIEINGLYWGDGDYQDYYLLSTSVMEGRGFLYGRRVDADTVYALIRVSYSVNDNAFSQDRDYTRSVQWNPKHPLDSLMKSDHLEIYIECGDDRWEWKQDLVYDADTGQGFEWRSDQFGPDGALVESPTHSPIPPSGIVVESHSSLEYDLENSSWITGQKALVGDNPSLWQSLDISPTGTISTVEVLTDVTSITGVHEDYPFFQSTGSESGDLWEWAISYEMELDVGHCGDQEVFAGVDSAHNSPSKDFEDVEIPTAITLGSVTSGSGSDRTFAAAVGFGVLVVASISAVTIDRRRNKKK